MYVTTLFANGDVVGVTRTVHPLAERACVRTQVGTFRVLHASPLPQGSEFTSGDHEVEAVVEPVSEASLEPLPRRKFYPIRPRREYVPRHHDSR